jgi:hypothetical protein
MGFLRQATASVVLSFLITNNLFAWGGRAHSVIERTAIDALPADGPVFLKKYVDYIAASSGIPDSWRGSSTPFSKIEEDPNHGWFREQFAFMKTIPRSRYEFVIALYQENQRIKEKDPENAARMNVRWTGTLPYAAAEVYGHLVAGMRGLRYAQLHGRPTEYFEQNCAFYAFWLGHYVGDGGQPMHDSIYSDGWRGPNPNHYGDGNVHGRFESEYVELIQLKESDIASRIKAPGHLDGDVFDSILAYLNASGDRVEEVFKLDKRGALKDPNDAEAREMIYSQTSSAAAMLRDLIYRAWLESALTNVKTANPLSEHNPLYNPETGSAPAGMSPKMTP